MLKYIIIIQKNIKGWIVRKKLKMIKDNMTIDILTRMIDKYNEYILFIKNINMELSKKKIRNINYPSEISENIVKFALLKKYKVCGNWDTNSGDLLLLDKRIEIKGFSSNGPSSFGPEEYWDWIYFIDCRDSINKNFIIYEIKLSNKNKIWRNIIISGSNNKKNSKIKKMGDLCDTGKGGIRPHITFESIKNQLGDKYCKIIFNGYLTDLI